METFLELTSKFSILFALVAAIVASLLANIVASLLQKVAGEHPRIKALGRRKQLCLVSILFVIFSLPAIYQQLFPNSTNKTPSTSSVQNSDSVNQAFRVHENDTINLFNNGLSITLVKYYCFSSTERQMVIGSPGFKNLTIDTLEIGDSFLYTGQKAYEIRIVKLDPACNWIEIQALELSEVPEKQQYTLQELKTESIAVKPGTTGFSSDNKLSISVMLSSPYSGVRAIFGSPGFPNKTISGKDIGYTMEYETDNNLYTIRITEVSMEAATFQIVSYQKVYPEK